MRFILWVSLSLLAVSCGKTEEPTPASIVGLTSTFTVTAPSMVAYVLNGVSNPTIALRRGNTYTFNLDVPGHPFYIKSVQSAGTVNAYSSGVTGNGATSGSILFAVPATAPGTLFYNCSNHAMMTGVINIVD